jgi:hypothetical protein
MRLKLKPPVNRTGICSARIAVADIGGKEFDEAVLCPLILGADLT